jgi:hypothetical protein
MKRTNNSPVTSPMKLRLLALATIALLLFTASGITAAEPTPEAIVQKQLEAYNAHDLDAFAATYAEDVELVELPNDTFVRGVAQLRERYAKAFGDSTLHAEVVNRMVVGNTVVDHERVRRRFPEGPGTIEAIAIYSVENGRIARVWFRRGERKLD